MQHNQSLHAAPRYDPPASEPLIHQRHQSSIQIQIKRRTLCIGDLICYGIPLVHDPLCIDNVQTILTTNGWELHQDIATWTNESGKTVQAFVEKTITFVEPSIFLTPSLSFSPSFFPPVESLSVAALCFLPRSADRRIGVVDKRRRGSSTMASSGSISKASCSGTMCST